MLSRLIAVILLLVGIVGIGISIVGVMFGFQVVDAIGDALDQTLALTSESLDTVNDTLVLTKQTVAQTGQAIGTVGNATDSVSLMLSDTRPLLDDVSKVATEDVPSSLDATQSAMPNLVAVAAAIDGTLESLSNFQYEETILGVPVGFDLGVEYDAEAPFDEWVDQVGTSLEGVPDSLRGLQVHLGAASDNLGTVSDDLHSLTGDLASIEGSVEEVGPLLDDYIGLVNQINDSIAQTRANVGNQLETVKTGIIILFVWFGLNQLVPLYLGADLITDGRLGSRPNPKEDEPQKEDESTAETETDEDQDGEDGEDETSDFSPAETTTDKSAE